MKKVVILVDQLYQHGGIETLVALKANYWDSEYHYSVTIVSTENKGEKSAYILNPSVRTVDLGINYNREISFFSKINVLKLFKNIKRLLKFINHEKPDFIVVASHIPLTYILPFLRLGKTKIIKEFHFTKYLKTKKRTGIKQKIFNYIESKYDKLIVLSDEERIFYSNNNVEVIPNPIPNEKLSKKTGLKTENIASSVLRFAPVKRIELMVAVWKLFIKKNPDWKLHIYGDYNNTYGLEIIELIEKENLENSIILKGKSSNILEEISKSKVFLLTSSQECFPMVILEAQSVGVPVISFDCPTGPRNIINDSIDGLLIDNDDVVMFANKLDEFAANATMQSKLSINSITNSKKYTMDVVMNMWKEKIFN